MDEDKLAAIKAGMDDEEMDMEKNSFEKRFGWYIILNRISQDDITKHKEVIEKTIIEVLNQLSYLIEKENEIERQRRRANGQIS